MNNYKIKNQGDDSAELLLYGIIGDYWDELDAKDIVQDLRKIEAKNITVRIYSDGGSVFAGLAIYNALKAHPANVTVKIDSLAASIASVIAMSGTVEMPENAFMMIHNPWGGAFGEAKDFEKMAEVLNKIKSSLMLVYQEKTGLGADTLSLMMDNETWLTAQEAKNLGFADTITGETHVDPKNHAKFFNSLQNCKNVPEQIRALIDKKTGTSKPDKKKETLNMDKDKGKTPVVTMELLRAEYPEIVNSLLTEGRKEGAIAECERIQAVSAAGLPGHEELINSLMYDGKTSGADAAMMVIRAEKKVRVEFQAKAKEDAIPPASHATPPEVEDKTGVKNLSPEERWEKDADIRDEFGDLETYKAFIEASEAGQVRVLKK